LFTTRNTLFILALSGSLWLLDGIASVSTSSAYAAEPGLQAAETVELKIKAGYQLFLPVEYGKDAAKKWPLIVFLHGSGERGTDLNRVKVHGPPKLVDKDPTFQFMVLSPQCPTGQRWNSMVLNALLDEIEAKYAIDRDRIYLTGLSLGGFGTWDWAMAEPNRFAAIAPICGRGEVRGAKRIKQIPAWVFHGDKDEAVPLKDSKDMVEALEKAGGKPKLTIYPDTGHDSWTKTYENPELYKWFLEQKLSDRKPEAPE
jgi:predicted peptidase